MADETINRLRVVFAEKDVTNKWVAEQLGYTEGMVSKWVRNNNQPPLETLRDISVLLKVDIRLLLESNAHLFVEKPAGSAK